MQKHFILPLSAAAIIVCLAGCSHSQDKDKEAVNTASTTTAASDSVAASDTQGTTTAPAATTVVTPTAPTTTTAHTAITQTAVIPAPRPVNLHPATYIIHRAPLVGGGGAPSTADTVQLIVKNLVADNGMRGSKIRVTQETSTIRLEGTANSVAQKNRAEDIVIAVQKQSRQQTGVENELVVNAPAQPADAGGGPIQVP